MRVRKLVVMLAAATFVAGCANSPSPPREELAAANLAVRQVQASAANRYAPNDVREADQKLREAQQAMEEEDYVRARRLAEKALVDAQLADVKADASRSGEIVAQSRESIEALEREALELSR